MLQHNDAIIALGANLPDQSGNPPLATCQWAVEAVSRRLGRIVARSSWYRTAPVPASDQPWFINGVVRLDCTGSPADILQTLHAIEREAGRTRRDRWEARILDLDLLAVGDQVLDGSDGPILPHPRLPERAFVLLPMAEVAATWRHPVSGLTVAEMAAALPDVSMVTKLP